MLGLILKGFILCSMSRHEQPQFEQRDAVVAERSPHELQLLSWRGEYLLSADYVTQPSAPIKLLPDAISITKSVGEISLGYGSNYLATHPDLLLRVKHVLLAEQMRDITDQLFDQGDINLLFELLPDCQDGAIDKMRLYRFVLEAGRFHLKFEHHIEHFIPDCVTVEEAFNDTVKTTMFSSKMLRNLFKVGLDPAAAYPTLIEHGLGVIILENVEHFPPGQIQLDEVLQYWSSVYDVDFRKAMTSLAITQGDAARIHDELLDQRKAVKVINNAEYFPEGSVRYDEVYRSLLQARHYEPIILKIEHFPVHMVDFEEIRDGLMWANNFQFIMEHIDTFPGDVVSIEDVVRGLVANRQFEVVLDHIQRISTVMPVPSVIALIDTAGGHFKLLRGLPKLPADAIDVLEMIEDRDTKVSPRGWAAIIQRSLRYILEYGVSGQAVFDQLRRKGVATNVMMYEENVRVLLEYGVNPNEVFELLLQANQLEKIASNLAIFPEDMPGLQKLISDVLEGDDYTLILRHWDSWPWHRLSQAEVKQHLLQGAPAEVLVEHINQFTEDEIGESGLVQSAIKECPQYLLANFQRFPDGVISDDHLRRLQLPVVEAIEQHRFRIVRLWMEQLIQAGDQEAIRGMFDEDGAVGILKQLCMTGRTRNAKELIACMKYAGIHVPDLDLEQVEQNRLVVDRVEGHEQEPRNLLDDIAQFYASTQLLHEINMLRSDPMAKHRLGFASQRELEEMHGRILNEVSDLYSWMQWYLINAVVTELREQDFTGSKIPFQVYIPNAAVMYEQAGEEQILDWFDAARARFSGSGWPRHFGGEPWAKIATAGYNFWANGESAHQPLIDHVVQLQHNGGFIFDKRADRVAVDNRQLKKLLDLKFNAVSFIDQIAEVEGVSAEMVEKIQDRYATILEAKRTLQAY